MLENQSSKEASQVELEQDLLEFLDSQTLSVLYLKIQEGKMDLSNIPWHPVVITNKFLRRRMNHS